MCKIIRVTGELLGRDNEPIVEEHELWIRDPVECLRNLIGNPSFREHMAYAPEKVYTDKEGRNRQYDEMWTGDWWWETQVSLIISSTPSTYALTISIAGKTTSRRDHFPDNPCI